MVLKFTLGKDKDKTIKNDRLAIFLSENLSVKLKAVLLHRFHGIRFKVSEDWLSRDNQFFLFLQLIPSKISLNLQSKYHTVYKQLITGKNTRHIF